MKIQARFPPATCCAKIGADVERRAVEHRRLRVGLHPAHRALARLAAPAGDGLAKLRPSRACALRSSSARSACAARSPARAARRSSSASRARARASFASSWAAAKRPVPVPSAMRTSRAARSAASAASPMAGALLRVQDLRGARVARQLHDLRRGHRLAEEEPREVRQVVRLVEDDRVGARQEVGHALVAQHHVGEEEVVVHDDDVGVVGALLRAFITKQSS